MPFRCFYRQALVALALCLVLVPAAIKAAPQVVVSIKPLELLVRAVATENTTITTLVPPGANPHNYAMKPSERRALGQADAVFWIGPQMETFLTKLLTGSDFASRAHALSTDEGERSEQIQDQGHNHDHEHVHHEGASDPHIWLDPALARNMVTQIHHELTELPDADLKALNANLETFANALTAMEAQIQRQLEPARDLSLFTYHNAFSHFAQHYGLNLAGVLTLNPDVSPGARHMAEVQDRLHKAARPCLMTEPPFNPQSWQAIAGDTNVTFSAWDPLASAIEPDRDAYLRFQQSVADAVLKCL